MTCVTQIFIVLGSTLCLYMPMGLLLTFAVLYLFPPFYAVLFFATDKYLSYCNCILYALSLGSNHKFDLIQQHCMLFRTHGHAVSMAASNQLIFLMQWNSLP